MPRESFYFELGQPRWTKIRDKWWTDLVWLYLACVIAAGFVYFFLRGIQQINGLWEWLNLGVGLVVVIIMLANCVYTLLESLRRRNELIARWRRIARHCRNQSTPERSLRRTLKFYHKFRARFARDPKCRVW